MTRSKSIIWMATALCAVALTAGCNRSDNTAQDTSRTIDQAPGTAATNADQAGAQVREQAANAGEAVDDAAITAKVKTALTAEPGLKALQINVDTANGIVTLSGAVDSPTNLDRATQVAQAVQGVKSVDNRLTVKQG